MKKPATVLWFLCLLVACAPRSTSSWTPEPLKLVAEPVTATVKREAVRLVHLQTEHAVLVTTPEHPFATPEGAWTPAGQLVSGDQVLSARDGMLRVLSVQQEQRAEPQAVFNLTVAPSHTYVVGTDQVLVHNRKCKDPAETEREIDAAERELQELEQRRWSATVEDRATLGQRLADVKSRLAKLKLRARNARAYLKRKRFGALAPAESPVSVESPASVESPVPVKSPVPVESRAPVESSESSESPGSPGIARIERALEELEREMGAMRGTTAGSSQRLAELRRERRRLKKYLGVLHVRVGDKKKPGTARLPIRTRLLKAAEADYQARNSAVEAAQRELSALLSEAPRSYPEKKSQAERRAALEKELTILRLERDASWEIVAAERRIVELTERSPSTDAGRQQIEEEQRALSAKLSKLRTARRSRESHRRKRADPKGWAERLRHARERWRKTFRTEDYLADTERPRDTLELMEGELAARRQEAGSGRLDERTEYLAEHIAAIKAMTARRRNHSRLQSALAYARTRRAELVDAGRETQEIDQKILRLVRERDASRSRIFQLRLREKVLERLDGTASRDAPNESDETRLREFERELEPAATGHLGEGRLREIQQELGESELIDAEFLESIWREAEAESGAHPIQQTVQDEAEDLDALLRDLESSGKRPSPERSATGEAGLRALQRELREERSAVEAADFALANEQAFLSQMLGGPGSSHHAAAAQRLVELQQRRLQLRSEWRERMQGRLDAARQALQVIQGIERLRDEGVEAELARKIALLEHEVNNPSF